MLAEYVKAIEYITFKWVKEKSKYRKFKKQVNQGCGRVQAEFFFKNLKRFKTNLFF